MKGFVGLGVLRSIPINETNTYKYIDNIARVLNIIIFLELKAIAKHYSMSFRFRLFGKYLMLAKDRNN